MTLQQLTDAALLRCISGSLAEMIDQALAAGVTANAIRDLARQRAGNTLTFCAVLAYLDAKEVSHA